MVGSVSATEQNDDLQITNDTDTVSTGYIVSEGANSANNNMLQSSADSDILSDGESAGTFSDLNTLIKELKVVVH